MLLNFWDGTQCQARYSFQFSRYGKQFAVADINRRSIEITLSTTMPNLDERNSCKCALDELDRVSETGPWPIIRIQLPNAETIRSEYLGVSRAVRKSVDVTRALSIIITTCPSIHLIPPAAFLGGSLIESRSRPIPRPSIRHI